MHFGQSIFFKYDNLCPFCQGYWHELEVHFKRNCYCLFVYEIHCKCDNLRAVSLPDQLTVRALNT